MVQAIALERAGRFAEAENLVQQILQCDPRHAEAMALLAYLDLSTGRFAQGVEHARKAIALSPDMADAHEVLGNALIGLGRLEEAMAAHEKAVDLEPSFPPYLVRLGADYWQACRAGDAFGAFRRALDLAPGDPDIHSNLLLAAVDVFVREPKRVYEGHRQWAQMHADPLASEIRPHKNVPDPERPLRIGYVTPPYSERAASYFLEPVFAAYDRAQFHVTCYWTRDYPLSHPGYKRWRSYPDRNRDVKHLSDAALAELIRNDEIDILVDTAGHTIGNRLLVFARKPAPVQVTYIGYQETTGLKTIDYRISDGYADPPGTTEAFFTEKIIRLPRAGYCYRAPEEKPEVGPLPARSKGYMTFGSTNRVSKMTPETVEAWSRVLKSVPGSKMIIRADGLSIGMLQRHVREMFASHGIDPERLELLGKAGMREYLETFQRIDLVLDCFPFNGHTVSCHALWMGVPVVSRVGFRHVARMGLSLLSNLGLSELVGGNGDEFVRIATGLANDLPRLEELRRTLRGRMEASPLMDQRGFGQEMAAAYRWMWRQWCKAENPKGRGDSHMGRGIVGVGGNYAVEGDPRSMSWAGVPVARRDG
jgi:predicted O-linked N-acetylglucosamine transferase (SPINDLY family)